MAPIHRIKAYISAPDVYDPPSIDDLRAMVDVFDAADRLTRKVWKTRAWGKMTNEHQAAARALDAAEHTPASIADLKAALEVGLL